MAAGIPNNELAEQLNSFMRSVTLLWSWQELQTMFETGDTYREIRGPDEGKWICFTLDVVEDDVQNGRRYVHVIVAASDSRSGVVKYSSYVPMCNSFIYYQDGELDIEYR